MRARAFSLIAVLGSCGTDDVGPYCESHELLRDQRSALCLSTHELAKRATTEIIATQGELEQAEVLIRTSFAALRPTFARVPRAASWNQDRGVVALIVTEPSIEAAWAAGLGPSGNPLLDQVVQAIDVWDFDYAPHIPAGHSASLWSRGAVSARNVESALQGVVGVEVYSYDETGENKASDVVDEGIDPTDGAHVVTYSIGWEDCLVGCRFAHHWRTKVDVDGTAWLASEWGDSLPPAVSQSIATPEPML